MKLRFIRFNKPTAAVFAGFMGLSVVLGTLATTSCRKKNEATSDAGDQPGGPSSASFTYCRAAKTVLADLPENAKVEGYVAPSDSHMTAFSKRLEAWIKGFAANSDGKVEATFSEMRDAPARARAKQFGIGEHLMDTDAGPHLIQSGIVLRVGSETETLKSVTPDNFDSIEFSLVNTLHELGDRAKHKRTRIGFLNGYGELPLSQADLGPTAMGKHSVESLAKQTLPRFSIEPVSISGTEPIDPGFSALLLTQPGRDLTDAELRRIDDFVMRGKTLLVFASAVNTKPRDREMHATLDTHRLDTLLAGYGVQMERASVLDFTSCFRTPPPGLLRYPAIPRASGNLDKKYPAFMQIGSAYFPLASPLTMASDKQPGAWMHVIASTSKDAVAKKWDGKEELIRTWPESVPDKATQNLAVAVEGTLTSAFDPARKSKGPARVVTVGSALFFANPVALATTDPNAPVTKPKPPEMPPLPVPIPKGMASDREPGGHGHDHGKGKGAEEKPADPAQEIAGHYATVAVSDMMLVLRNVMDLSTLDTEFVKCIHDGAK